MKPQESRELPYSDIAVGINASVLSPHEIRHQHDVLQSIRQLLAHHGYVVDALRYDLGSPARSEKKRKPKLETNSANPAVLVVSAKDGDPTAVIADEIRALLQPLIDRVFLQSPDPLLIITRTVSKPTSQKVGVNGQLTDHPLVSE